LQWQIVASGRGEDSTSVELAHNQIGAEINIEGAKFSILAVVVRGETCGTQIDNKLSATEASALDLLTKIHPLHVIANH